MLGTLAMKSSFAEGNQQGNIDIKGVVPGVWELTVYDINSGFDFDLSDTSSDMSTRIGTIHVRANSGGGDTDGVLFIESANAGRLINHSTGPGIAAENQVYLFDLVQNDLDNQQPSLVDSTYSNLDPVAYPNRFNLVVPAYVRFYEADSKSTYDIEITIPASQRPEAAGVYTDTITFTIMDDGIPAPP